LISYCQIGWSSLLDKMMELTITSSSCHCIIISSVKVLLKVPPVFKQSLFRSFIYSWVYILSCSIYLIYEGIISLYHSRYTLLIILIYLNISSMENSSSKSLIFLIYHFYVQKCSIYVNNIRYIDLVDFFIKLTLWYLVFTNEVY
jgi:hypothetical protein